MIDRSTFIFQDIIEIPYTLTFAELQKILESKVGIPVSRQHIKHGFPPKFITVPYENLHAPYTLIQNNDRLVVEDKRKCSQKTFIQKFMRNYKL